MPEGSQELLITLILAAGISFFLFLFIFWVVAAIAAVLAVPYLCLTGERRKRKP